MNNEKSIWEILGTEPVKDKRQIKRAYAHALKTCHPEEHPEAFQRLYNAYQQALAFADSSEEIVIHAAPDMSEEEILKKISQIAGAIVQESAQNQQELGAGADTGTEEEAFWQKGVSGVSREPGTESPENEDPENISDEQKRIGRFFTEREHVRTKALERFRNMAAWFQENWQIQQAQEDMARYLASDSFAEIREEDAVLRYLYRGLNDRKSIFGNKVKDALWFQYKFSMVEIPDADEDYYAIYKILQRERKSRMLREENQQFQILMEECERISAKKRKKIYKALYAVVIACLIVAHVVMVSQAVEDFLVNLAVRKLYQSWSGDVLIEMEEKYPHIRFEEPEIKRRREEGKYEFLTDAEDEDLHFYQVSMQVARMKDGSLQILDNLGPQLVNKAEEKYQIKLELADGADSVLVAYYSPDEEGDMERVCDFLKSTAFQEQFGWISEVVFCYKDVAFPQFFLEGGEGGLPKAVQYAVKDIPEKEQLMEELFFQGVFYYMHYIPWQMKQDLLVEYTETYNLAAAEFDEAQKAFLLEAEAELGIQQARYGQSLVRLAQTYGVKLLLFQSGAQICITQGDFYRLLLAMEADVERNKQHDGFVLRMKNGNLTIWGAGMEVHTIGCEDAWNYVR